jgi:hypothetical protein
MAQQTVVESIIVDLDNECKARGMFVNWDMYLAKEKEQIMNANVAGMEFIAVDPTLYQQDAEQYYNEEYNK